MSVSSLVALLMRGRGTSGVGTRPHKELPSSRVGEHTWKGGPKGVRVPYPKHELPPAVIPSSAGTVQTGVNLWGPPHKSKYSLATDSEPVP